MKNSCQKSLAGLKAIRVPGFSFATHACGIKQTAADDLALILSAKPATCAGVFTRNALRAAPVLLTEKHCRLGKARLIVVNSGNANAATGAKGVRDAQTTVQKVAEQHHVPPKEVLVCSTGKIGQPLPMPKLLKGVEKTRGHFSEKFFYKAAQAIMTTDAYPKWSFQKAIWQGKVFHVAVMAKGAGMIQPDMATLLCFVLTDLDIPKKFLQKLLRESVAVSLNALTVDGDTSTNDTALILANGVSQVAVKNTNGKLYKQVASLLKNSLIDVAKQIARDGEGATKCLEVTVKNAKTLDEAKKVAFAIANSPLVKTACYGNDPNWGRIVAAAGKVLPALNPQKVTLTLGKSILYKKGEPLSKSEKPANQFLRHHDIVPIVLDVARGKYQFTVYASDLTTDYVHFNADYRT